MYQASKQPQCNDEHLSLKETTPRTKYYIRENVNVKETELTWNQDEILAAESSESLNCSLWTALPQAYRSANRTAFGYLGNSNDDDYVH